MAPSLTGETGGAGPGRSIDGEPASQPRPRPSVLRALLDGGPLSLAVRGRSMGPCLEDGGRVTLARLRLPLPGDVLVFQDDRGRLVAHRFLGPYLRRRRLRLLLKGDAAPGPDPGVAPGAVVGRIVTRVRLLERWGAVRAWARHAVHRRRAG